MIRSPTGSGLVLVCTLVRSLLVGLRDRGLDVTTPVLTPAPPVSLREGMTETLTVLLLDVPSTLAMTLRSTNAIESMIGSAANTPERQTLA